MKVVALLSFALLSLASLSPGAVVITQYYEGASFDKWIELTNLGATEADLSTISVTLWSNANTEAWRTGGAPSQSLTLSGTLASGATILLSHASAAAPLYATADVANSGVINFNGDDSIVVYDGAITPANILDAMTFTDAGAEGTNTSVVRISTGTGFSLTSGSTFQDLPAVWSQFSNAAVDTALPGTNERLGESTVSPIPEPGLAFLGALGFLVLLHRKK